MTVVSKLRIEGVWKTFQSRNGQFVALRDIDLVLKENEFLSVVGPSGCGKSTLLEIVAGLQRATRGRVLLDDRVITAPGRDRAVVFQHYALFPWRTVIDNVAFPLEVAGVSRDKRKQQAAAALHLVNLDGFADHHVWELSGGMQQRVGLARALACDPEVLLMDEPFSGADAITRELLQDQLRELHQQTHKTVLFITHSVDEALRLSDRIVVLGTRPGRIVAEFVGPFDLTNRGSAGRRPVADIRDEIWGLLRTAIEGAKSSGH